MEELRGRAGGEPGGGGRVSPAVASADDDRAAGRPIGCPAGDGAPRSVLARILPLRPIPRCDVAAGRLPRFSFLVPLRPAHSPALAASSPESMEASSRHIVPMSLREDTPFGPRAPVRRTVPVSCREGETAGTV